MPHVPAVSDIESLGIVSKTISCLSSAARILSREFKLGWSSRNKGGRKEMASKENVHGDERAEIELSHDEGGNQVYERISIREELDMVSTTRRHGCRKEQYQYDAGDSKHSAELHNG